MSIRKFTFNVKGNLLFEEDKTFYLLKQENKTVKIDILEFNVSEKQLAKDSGETVGNLLKYSYYFV